MPGPIPRDYQDKAIDAGCDFFTDKRHYNGLIILPTGCHARGTGILMYDGTIKLVEEILPMDLIMGPDSRPRMVINLCGGFEEMYKIKPIKGESFIVNEGHILCLISTNEGKKNSFSCYQKGGEKTFISVGDYLLKSKSFKHLRKLSKSGCINFQKQKTILPIDSWMLGIMLGDGCFMNGSISFTTMDIEIEKEMISNAFKFNCIIRKETKPNNIASNFYFVKKDFRRNNTVSNQLMNYIKKIGLNGMNSENKFIPNIYKYSAIKDRYNILAGLLDSDGSHDGRGGFDYISKSIRLANDVCFICRSLGLSANISPCKKASQNGTVGDYFRVYISGNTNLIPCRVKRKKAPKRKQIKNHLLTGFTIEPLGKDFYYGFTLNDDYLYLTSDFTIHHNSGKSVVAANIIGRINEPMGILQPNKEILQQNFSKYISYGYRAGIYSASAGMKFIDDVTFCTIGSVVKKPHLFKKHRKWIIDECHLVNAEEGMYKDFMTALDHPKVLGLTASPYRLEQTGYGTSMLKFLNRTNPRFFNKVNYYIQNMLLFEAGHLADLEYWDFTVIDRKELILNSSGSDYTTESLRRYYAKIDFPTKTIEMGNRLLAKRKNLVIFCSLISEAKTVQKGIPGSYVVSNDTPDDERDRILSQFKRGIIKCVINVGIISIGFDYPELEACLLAFSTMSLARYYQCIGRIMRPHINKIKAWVVDLGGNMQRFGPIETMEIRQDKSLFFIYNEGYGQLTNIPFYK